MTPARTRNTPRPNVWVVRANGGRNTDKFITGRFIAVGWFDLSSATSRDEIRQRYEQEYPDAPAGQIANEIGQLAAFRLDIGEGDYVVTPGADREWLYYGRVTGPWIAATDDEDRYRYPNRRAVAGRRLDPSTPQPVEFTESFQRTLGSPRTVFRVNQREEFIAAIGSSTRLGLDDPSESDTSHDAVEMSHNSPRNGTFATSDTSYRLGA